MILRMRGLADIHLDVRGGDIIVDLPGTSYTVTYHKPAVPEPGIGCDVSAQHDIAASRSCAALRSRGSIGTISTADPDGAGTKMAVDTRR